MRLDRSLIGLKNLQLFNHVPADLPFVQADEKRLQQILHNLIGNAIKFTPSGTVEVSAKVVGAAQETEGEPGLRCQQIAISISDTGIGIPADKLDRVFESHIPPFPLAQEEYHCFNSASSTADRWSPKTGVFDAAHPLNSPLASPHSAPRSGRP